MKLTSETIKNAVFGELKELFPNITVYKEQITLPSFPHFFINQLNVSTTENRKNRYFKTYLMNIRYRQVADPSNEARIEQELDEVGHKLVEDFVKIQLNNRPHKIREAYYEKANGVLHFSCQVRVQVEKQKEETAKMNSMTLNVIPKVDSKPIINDDVLFLHEYLSKFTHNQLITLSQGELSKYA